jgi:hypothetical protein
VEEEDEQLLAPVTHLDKQGGGEESKEGRRVRRIRGKADDTHQGEDLDIVLVWYEDLFQTYKV